MKLIQWLPLLALIFFTPISSSSPKNIPRLTLFSETITRNPTPNDLRSSSDDFKTYFYNQTLDHFNYNPDSYTTFQQRYMMNDKYWGGAKSCAPIFAYLGEESSLDSDIEFIGFLTENAPRFKSLVVYIEHRYYGQSIPYGSYGLPVENKTIPGYFNSAQALADYAEVLLHIKHTLSAQLSPLIVVGASYGGMLASWFRLKYPHIAMGALASSAPILYFDDITPQDGYYSVVSKDFKEESESCYETIRKSWTEIYKIASEPDGLLTLSTKFKTCMPLSSSDELSSHLERIYMASAQYNAPPDYPVSAICGGIDGAPNGTDILGRVFAGLVAHLGNRSCYINSVDQPFNHTTYELGWGWQRCADMVMPIGLDNNETMFMPNPFNLTSYIEDCKSSYGVLPRPHWVTTYYGGHDIKRVLHKFASNIIFSNGLRDPYSSGGVLENISKTVRAVTTLKGSHCLDILIANVTTDPQWLIEQRETEVRIIEGWLTKYYDDII